MSTKTLKSVRGLGGQHMFSSTINAVSDVLLKLYCRYEYTKPCMINRFWGLKQLRLQVNGHALLGTAAPYGCNDHIDSIGNLTSPGCKSVNVLNLFDRTSRRHRSHGSRKYNKSEIHNVSFDGLLPFVNLQLGLHHIRTRL